MAITDIGPELRDLGLALGVLEAGGDLRTAFFADPLGEAAGMLRDPARRTALSDLLDSLVPPDAAAPAEPGETWHPLTDPTAAARLYLTRRGTAGGLVLGLALRVATTAAGDVPATGLTLAVGLVEAADGGLRTVVGTADGPVRARLDVTFASDDAGFSAVVLDAALTPGDAQPLTVRLALSGLQVDGQAVPPVVVDPTHLGRDAVPLLETLLGDRLSALGTGPDVPAALARLAANLPPLLGLAGAVPRLPVHLIGVQPGVIGTWFAGVLDAVPSGGGAAGSAWLAHLAALLGSDVPPAGTGTEADPWRVPLPVPGGDDRVEVTLASRTAAAARDVLVGVSVGLTGPGGIGLDAGGALLSLPLTGTGRPRAVPSAAVLVRAPSDPSAVLVASDEIHVRFAQGGLRWDGSALRPVLELGGVSFDGAAYEVLDLAHADSVRAAAADAVRAALAGALGAEGPGAHLAVLLGLLAPAGESGAPLADPVRLVTAPTRELARVHRARLLDPQHPWSAMLAELAALLGVTGPVAGAGSASDPWHVAVAAVGPVSVEIAAWTAGAVPALHLGLRVTASTDVGISTVSATVDAEVVALTFPSGAPVVAALLPRLAARLVLIGPFTLAPLESAALTVGGADAAVSWQPGGSPDVVLELTGLTVHLDDADVTVPVLHVSPTGFAPDQPDLGLGIPVADLDRLVRALLARLWQAAAGQTAAVAAGLLGLVESDGLPEGWPALTLPPGGLGELLSDPLAALRQWLVRLALEQAADATPFAWALLEGLRQLVRPDATTADVDIDVTGVGTWAVPWRIELGSPGASQLLLWLEPDGPPDSWGAAAAQQATDLDGPDLPAIMARFGADVPELAGVFGAPDGPAQADRLRAGLAALVRDCTDSDGIVPVGAQVPAGAGWAVAATLVDAAHHRLPEHADAVAQVLAQVDAWAPEPGRAVLLIGPPFTGRASWDPLLAAAEAARPGVTNPGAHFDLRTPPSPDVADLAATTATASWYTADLADAGGPPDAVVAQIAAVVGRIRELRGELPVVLVAHSTAGLAARAFAAAADPQVVAGLITIGTPHGPAPLTVLDDPDEADAVRVTARLLAGAGTTGSLRDALDQLVAVSEGWQPTATLPSPLAYRRERFAGDTEHGTGGAPALAVVGQLSDDPTVRLGAALAHTLTAGAARRPPTHLGLGVRGGPVGPPTVLGEVTVDAGLRVDAIRIPLLPGVGVDPSGPRRIAVEVRIDRPGGWLVQPQGGQGTRVRRADLGVVVELGAGAGPAQATAVFHDAAVDGPTAPRLTLADPAGARLLGAVVAAAAGGGDDGAALVDALVAVGLATRDGTGAPVLVADAVDAVQADAAGFLADRARAALSTGAGLFGVSGPVGGPWSATDADAPLAVELADDHLTVRLAALQVAGATLSGDLVWTAGSAGPRVTVTAAAGSGTLLRWDVAAGTLALVPAPPGDSVTLLPDPGGSALAERLGPLLLEQLVAAVAGAALLDRLGPGWQLGPLTRLLFHPEQALLDSARQVDGDRVGALLGVLNDVIGLPVPIPTTGAVERAGLRLPGGLVLSAAGTPCRLSLRTDPPIAVPGPGDGPGGTVGVELDVTVPDLVTLPGVAGRLTLDVPLGGTWGGVGVALGLDDGTVSLAVTPRAPGGSALAPIVLLPHFGGLGPLAADAAALLPAVLDKLEAELPQPHPAVADAVLAVADAVGIHGGPGDPTFAAHIDTIKALAGGNGLDTLAQTGLPAAVVQLWQVAGLPGAVTAATNGVSVAATFGAVTVAVDTGWGAAPLARVVVDGLTAGPLALDGVQVGVTAGVVSGGLTATVALPPEAEELLGLRLAPSLRLALDGGPLLTLRPLGQDVDLVEAQLLPSARLDVAAGGLAALLEQVLLPLAAQAVLDRVPLDRPLISGGPSAGEVLRSAKVLAPDAPRLAVPLPPLTDAVPNILAVLAATDMSIDLSDDLRLVTVADRTVTPARVGLGLHGHPDAVGTAVRASVRFGEAAPTWLPDAAPALRLLLIEEETWRLRPSLRLAPLGLKVEGPADAPLLDTDDVHLGAVTAYLWADLDLDGHVANDAVGGAVDLTELGLPLGAVASGDDAANPVAASLLGSGGGGAPGAGDPQAVTPGLSLVAASRPGDRFALLRREDDAWLPFAQRPIWFAIHRSFGPLAIDQIGFGHEPAPAGSDRPGTVELLVDGGVQVGPLTVQAHELGIGVPLDRLDRPGTWELDLGGLAVAFRTTTLALAGGLVKRPGPPLDYAGTVTVSVAGRTFTAVGAYGRPADQQGEFTSLFVFVGLPMVLGGPPALFVTGLGGGAGYNRRLVPPAQITDVPTFPLVTAIDDGANDDPAGTLARMGAAMPPQRGSLWLAAGLRFTSFSFVHSIGVLYVSLDRGVEIGVVGVARAAIPPPDAGAGSLELASVELALRARFSTADGVLSIQAQLTDNSWVLSPDCQLTGGFAFFVWFRRDQFVLTLGGYHPSFVRPPEFPVVPRLGFHWAVSDAVVVKGEAYFALTSSCVMAGGRLEVAFDDAGIYASFTAYADFLIAWDPFRYDVQVGVSVTAGFRLRVCFFACVTIDVHVTLGASVHLLGPPLRGEATLDLEICSVTVAFGNEPHGPPAFLGWEAFRDTYLVAGAADGNAVTVQASAGLVPPDDAAAAPAPGSPAHPWRLAGTFSLRTETRLAATGFSVNGAVVAVPLTDGLHPVPQRLDLAPMNVAAVSGIHDLTVTSTTSGAPPVDMSGLDIQPVVGHVPAAVWAITDRPAAGAETVPVLAGLVVTGRPRIADDADRPPISVDLIDFNTVPVPIGLLAATPAVPPAADPRLAELVSTADPSRLARVAAAVLGDAGSAARARAGLDPAPLPARGVRSLRTRRSSPPLLTTLGGPAVAPGAPTASAGPPVPAGVRPSVAPPASKPAPQPIPQPVPRVLARLRGPVTRAPAAAAGRSLPAADGRPLAPGELQVWDLPVSGDGSGRVLVSGPGAARVVVLDRAGLPLHDDVVAAGAVVSAPEGAARVVVAPAVAGPPVRGWQSGTLLAQVARATLLAPGATVHLAAPLYTWRDGRRTTQALVRASAAVGGPGPVVTRLAGPAGDLDLGGVVAVVVDALTSAVPADLPADLPGVEIDRAEAGPPTVVVGGHRLHLLYPLNPAGGPTTTLAVRVTPGAGWRPAGVLAGPGTVEDWLPRVTGPGSGIAVPAAPPAAGVAIRYEARR